MFAGMGKSMIYLALVKLGHLRVTKPFAVKQRGIVVVLVPLVSIADDMIRDLSRSKAGNYAFLCVPGSQIIRLTMSCVRRWRAVRHSILPIDLRQREDPPRQRQGRRGRRGGGGVHYARDRGQDGHALPKQSIQRGTAGHVP